jgi:hypothetical protein
LTASLARQARRPGETDSTRVATVQLRAVQVSLCPVSADACSTSAGQEIMSENFACRQISLQGAEPWPASEERATIATESSCPYPRMGPARCEASGFHLDPGTDSPITRSADNVARVSRKDGRARLPIPVATHT